MELALHERNFAGQDITIDVIEKIEPEQQSEG
jgi:hypothetical protein